MTLHPPLTASPAPRSVTPERDLVGIEWQVQLDVKRPADIEPRHLHAVVSVAIEKATSNGTNDVLHRSSEKPYTMSPLWEGEDGKPRFTLCTLGCGVRPPDKLEKVRLGGQTAVICWGDAVVDRVVSRSDLESLEPVRSVVVRFETPMTRRKGDLYFPSPNEVSLLESWERAADKVGLDRRIDWKSVAARFLHVDGHTTQWSPPQRSRGRQHRPIGFVGEVELEVPPPQGQRLHQLAVLATFAGSGAHTTYGMGLTSLITANPINPDSHQR